MDMKKWNHIKPVLMEALQMLQFFYKKSCLHFLAGLLVEEKDLEESSKDPLAKLFSKNVDHMDKSLDKLLISLADVPSPYMPTNMFKAMSFGSDRSDLVSSSLLFLTTLFSSSLKSNISHCMLSGSPSLQINGKYKLANKIGGSSQGDIFCAWNILSGAEVTVKLWHSEFSRALEHEYHIYKLLTAGPGILHLYWFGTDYGFHAMVTEHSGSWLQDLVSQSDHKFSIDVIAGIGLQMITCLEFMYARNFIHHDIKPSNILTGVDGSQDLSPPLLLRTHAIYRH
ncbi:kinase-like domain-containing protein [Pisolithus thermaeus]|nr:kinase-like domain-containing protein [Pisolithus croceorrhizus]KAI6137606.1 kinase-like domain-containing protein [Pisolithus thermaeus]